QGAVGVHQYVTRTGASYQGQPVRAVGTFGAQDVMGMATVVSLGLVCALGLALGRAPLRERLVAAGFVLVLLPPLALSFSRGAWIATAVACTVQLLLAGLRRALAAGAVVAAVAVVLAGGFGVGQSMLQERVGSITRVTDTPDQSVTDRYTMWAAAAGMWREQPLTGVGLKGFPEHRDSHASLALSSGSDTEGAGAAFRRQPLLSPHNMYLLVLAEQGLIGLLALAGGRLALLGCAVRGVWRVRRAGGPRLDCGLVAGGRLVRPLTGVSYAPTRSPSGGLLAGGRLVRRRTGSSSAGMRGSSTVLSGPSLGLAAGWASAGATVPPRAGAGAASAAHGAAGGAGAR